MSLLRGRGLALGCAMLGAVGFSGKAIVAKLLYRHGLDATAVLGLRMLLAWPLFLALAWWAGRGQPAPDGPTWRRLLLLGFTGYYLASYLDFLGLQHISASLERLILYLNPTLVLALGVLLHGVVVQRRQLVALALSYAGVVLAFGHELARGGAAAGQGASVGLGAALVFGSALSYAVYLVASGELVKRLGALRLVGLASSLACLLAVVHAAPALAPARLAALPAEVWALAVLNSVACTVAPVLLVMLAIERLGPALASHAGMVGPLATLVLGWAVLGEPLGAWVLAGTALVLLGVALLAWRGAPADEGLPRPPRA